MASTITIEGTEYELPTKFTIGELKTFKEVGADMPDGGGGFDAFQLVAMIVIVKRRAGEVVDIAALDELTTEDFTVVVDELPPPPRAARRGNGGQVKTVGNSGVPSSSPSSTSIPG